MQVWLYFHEVALFVIFLVQFAFTYPTGPEGTPSAREIQIENVYPFSCNATLAGIALVGTTRGPCFVCLFTMPDLCSVNFIMYDYELR